MSIEEKIKAYHQKESNYRKRFNYNDSTNYWVEIKGDNDVKRKNLFVKNTIGEYSKVKMVELFSSDIDDLRNIMGEYEIALDKILNKDYCKYFTFSEDKIIELINDYFVYDEKISHIAMRKAFQD